MAPVPLRKLVSSIALFAALVIAITGPIGYLINRSIDDANVLTFKASINAGRVAKYIYTHGAMWQYQSLRIAEVIQLPESEQTRQRVFDNSGRVVCEEGPPVDFPVLRRRVPIIVSGVQMGEMEAAASFLPAMIDIGIVTLCSWALAFLVYFAVRMLPLRVLDRTLSELAVQNSRFEAALDNMTQGLCMLDAAHKVAVINRRFAAMFGIGDRDRLIGASPPELAEATLQTAKLTRPIADTLFLLPELGAAQGPGTSFSRDIPDGRTITVCRRVVDDGSWVTTFEDITERRRAEAQLDHIALHDALTNLPNRILFRVHLERELAAVARSGALALLCLDLDRFKGVNDTLGHPIGDALLQAVAERLKSSIRDCDIVVRLGGDEFAIIQSCVEQPMNATSLARRLVEAIAAPYQIDQHQIVVGVSIGIALAPADGNSPDDILKKADLALYRAKAEGRGTYRFFEPTMDAQMQARRNLEIDLRHALADNEFDLYFQPLITMATGRVAGFEALLRWQHPARGLVLPDEFVPAAEEIGLIIPIGEWVLRAACLQAATWPEDIKLAVNFSVIQFRSPNLVDAVVQALQSSGLPANRLDIEITESVLMQDSQTTLATLRRLHDLGVRISMDDFGTGYSSLSYLRSFPFDKIKIDKCFIRDLGSNNESTAIIRAVVHLGRALGMSVIAEGVETEDQLARIKEEGCAECQGFLFSPPCPSHEIVALLERLHAVGQRNPQTPADLAA